MDNKEKSPEQELIESIGLMLDKGLETNTDVYTGVLKSINGKKAVVTMNGQDQNVAVVSPDLLAGMATRVFVPNGNMSNAFIIGGGGSEKPTLPTVQIATGSYVGSGNANERTLTFNFSPRYVSIQGFDSTGWRSATILQYPAAHYVSELYNTSPTRSAEFVVSWSGNSVSWKGSNAERGLNMSNSTYYYFAIGI